MNNTNNTVQAAIFDWAGTTVDFGSVAPIEAFKALFEREDITVSDADCRAPMGTEKSEHIRQMLAMPKIAQQWETLYQRSPSEKDVQRLYHEFLPLQLETIQEFSQVIPGCLDTMAYLKDKKIKIGSNTGYNEEMYALVAKTAEQQGFTTQSNVCATQVSKGRPYPYMAQAVMEELGILDAATCIKVDDTETGLEEGRHAGMWTVGVSISGNALGLRQAQWEALNQEEQSNLRQGAEEKLAKVNPHYIIDSVAELPNVIERINARLMRGERP